MRRRRPYVTVFVTMSADGKIASVVRDSRLSCPFDKKRQHALRASHDAVVVGASTVLIDDPLLTVRLVKGPNPKRVIIDGRLRIPLNSRVVTNKDAETIVLTCSSNGGSEKITALLEAGVKVLTFPCVNGIIDLNEALLRLKEEGISSILVEGGGELLWHFFRLSLVDEFRVTISPYIIGGRDAVTPVEGHGFGTLSEWVKLRLIHVIRCECGNEVHLVYRVLGRNA